MLNDSDTYHCLSKGRARIFCQVAGCEADVESDGAYCVKRRVCLKHLKADVVFRRGYGSQPWRFCHQCGKLEPLTKFDGARRSCREQLRRRRQAGKAVQKKIAIKSSSSISERVSYHKSVKPLCTEADSVRSVYDDHLLLWMQQQTQLQQQQILRQQEEIERLQALQQQQRRQYSALLAELQCAVAKGSAENQASAPAQPGSALPVVVEDLEPPTASHLDDTAVTPGGAWAASNHTGLITALQTANAKPQASACSSGFPVAVLTGSAAPTAVPAAAEWAQTLTAAGTEDAPAVTAQNAAAATGAGTAQMRQQQQQQTQTVNQSAVRDVSLAVPPIAVSSTAMLTSSFASISQAQAAASAATVIPMPESIQLSGSESPQNQVFPAVVVHPAVSVRPYHGSSPGAATAAVGADGGTAHLGVGNATVGTSNQTWRAVVSDAAAAAAPAAVAEVLPYWGDPRVAAFPAPIPVFPTYPGQNNHHPAAMAPAAAERGQTPQPIDTCSMGNTRDGFMHLLQQLPSGCLADVTMSFEDLTELLETALAQAVQQRQQYTDNKALPVGLPMGLPPCPAAAAVPVGVATLPADLNYGANDAAPANLHLQQLLEPQLPHFREQQTGALCSMVMSQQSITHDSFILALNKMTSIRTPDSFDDLAQVLSAALEDSDLPKKQGTGEAQQTGMQKHQEWSHSSAPQDRNGVLSLL